MPRFGSGRLGLPRELPGTGTVRRALIEAGGPADGRSGDRKTPLITAASYRDAEIARALIEAGADIASRPQRLRMAAALRGAKRVRPQDRRIMLACVRFERADPAPQAVPDGWWRAAGLLRPGRSSIPSRQLSSGGTPMLTTGHVDHFRTFGLRQCAARRG
jgi:ankyrin repeat protein